MGVGLVAVELRTVAEPVADGDAGDVQAPSRGQRQAFVDVESVERIEAVISVTRTRVDGSKADIAERVDYRAVPRNRAIDRHDEIRVDESKGAVGVEAAAAVIEATAQQKIVAVAEQAVGARGLQRTAQRGRVIGCTVNRPVRSHVAGIAGSWRTSDR